MHLLADMLASIMVTHENEAFFTVHIKVIFQIIDDFFVQKKHIFISSINASP